MASPLAPLSPASARSAVDGSSALNPVRLSSISVATSETAAYSADDTATPTMLPVVFSNHCAHGGVAPPTSSEHI
ncbi:hypothetical protein J2797_003354 [Paraburkholderia terricola]|nr:hypothetical protein [Paraburkholderia terricola]